MEKEIKYRGYTIVTAIFAQVGGYYAEIWKYGAKIKRLSFYKRRKEAEEGAFAWIDEYMDNEIY